MIVSIAKVLLGQDLSTYVERDGFEIEAAVGKRMDVTRFTLFDPNLQLAVPDRAEMWIYDANGDPQLRSIGTDSNDGYPVGSTGAWSGGLPAIVNGVTTLPQVGGNYLLSSPNFDDVYVLARFKLTSGAGQSQSFRLIARANSVNGTNYIQCYFQNGAWYFQDVVNGVMNSTYSGGVTGGGTLTDGVWYWAKFTVVGGFMQAEVRADQGNSFPGARIGTLAVAYNPNAARGGPQASGQTGLQTWVAGGTGGSVQVGGNFAGVYQVRGAVVDPNNAISAYNTYINGSGYEVTNTLANCSGRLFAGFVATPDYVLDGGQRLVHVTAQDYTVRLRTTVANKAFQAALSDQTIVQQIFNQYWAEVDTSNVQSTVASMPAISFPVHTLEQFMERIIKVSRAVYRVDYYKRLFYGLLGQTSAPYSLSDTPDGINSIGFEDPHFSPDGAALINKAWVKGSTYLSQVMTYQVPVAQVTGSSFQFPLPGDPELSGMVVKVNNVDQGTGGVVPASGDIVNQSTYKYSWLIQHAPAYLAFKTTPANGATITVTGRFRYPLITTVSDSTLIQATNGIVFEAVVRDNRIADLGLAQQVGNAYLKQQGNSMKGGSCVVKRRGKGSNLFQPGQAVSIRHATLFAGLLPGGSVTLNGLITRLNIKLEDDAAEPYVITLDFADRYYGGGY